MKTCFKCGALKPLSEFYANRGMADGRLGKCKECTKVDVKSNYRQRHLQYTKYERSAGRVASRHRRSLTNLRTYRAANPAKYKARNAVSNDVRDGRIRKQPCEVCGVERVEAHHEDYAKPLDVRWLLPSASL